MEKIIKKKLDNGLTVILEERHLSPVVAINFFIKAGTVNEETGQEGIAHFLEHTLFKGTTFRDKKRIIYEIESVGGEINAWTSYEMTSLYAVLSGRYLDVGLDVLFDVLCFSKFDEKEIEIERGVILEEISQTIDSPDFQMEQGLMSLAFGNHPMGRPIFGYTENVKKISRKNIIDFYTKWYTSENTVLVIVGDFDSDIVLSKVEEKSKYLRRGNTKFKFNKKTGFQGFNKKIIQKDLNETRLSLGFITPPFGDDFSLISTLVAVLLAGSENGILYREMVRYKNLVADLNTEVYSENSGGIFYVESWNKPENTLEALKGMLHFLFSLKDMDIPESNIERAKKQIIHSKIYQQETVQGEASRLGLYEIMTGDFDFDARMFEKINSIKKEDIKEFAKKFLVPENLSIFGILTKDNSDLLKQKSYLIDEIVNNTFKQKKKSNSVKNKNTIEKININNGECTLILKQDPSMPLVFGVAAMKGGGRFEAEKNSGISNLTSNLLTKGTKNYNEKIILDTFESIGGSISGFAGKNTIGVETNFISKYFDKGFEVFKEVIFHPLFHEKEFEIAKREHLQDLVAKDDSPFNLGMDTLLSIHFKGHPYSRSILGTVPSVSKLKREDVVEHYRRHLKKRNLVISLVGDFDKKSVIAEIEKEISKLEEFRENPFAKIPIKRPSGVIKKHIVRNEPQSHLFFAFPGFTFVSKERYPQQILSYLLTGQAGRLYMALRESHGKIYGIDSYPYEGIDQAGFVIYFSTTPQNVEACFDILWKTIRDIKRNSFSMEEIKRAKKYLVGSIDIYFQKRRNIAYNLAYNEIYGIGYEEFSRYAEKINRVTKKDIYEVFLKIFDEKNFTEVIVSPEY